MNGFQLDWFKERSENITCRSIGDKIRERSNIQIVGTATGPFDWPAMIVASFSVYQTMLPTPCAPNAARAALVPLFLRQTTPAALDFPYQSLNRYFKIRFQLNRSNFKTSIYRALQALAHRTAPHDRRSRGFSLETPAKCPYLQQVGAPFVQLCIGIDCR